MSPRTWGSHCTFGGVVVDDAYRTLDEQGQPVPGLYAVGELVNGNLGVGVIGNGVTAARGIFAQ